MSTRKPHNDILGYVCELRNRRTGVGHVVIYDRNKGFDCDAEYRYIISCETHNTMTSAPSMPKAREIMKAVDFCEECMKMPLDPTYNPDPPSGDVWMTNSTYIGL